MVSLSNVKKVQFKKTSSVFCVRLKTCDKNAKVECKTFEIINKTSALQIFSLANMCPILLINKCGDSGITEVKYQTLLHLIRRHVRAYRVAIDTR